MPRRHVKIAPGGRVVIPAEYRKALGIKVGDHVVIELQDDELRVRSRRAAIRKLQALVRQYIPDESRSLARELIEERRREAAYEKRK